jgi:hypothetical protein
MLLTAVLASQVSAQTSISPTLSGRDQQHLVDQLNLQMGGNIVALPRGDYESQMAAVRMIPGFKDELAKLRSVVAQLSAELAAHKVALAELLAENEALKQQLNTVAAPAEGGQP